MSSLTGRSAGIVASDFKPGDPVLIPGVVRRVYDAGHGWLLEVELGREDGRTGIVTVGERVPVAVPA
jgi:hypothetical protein